MSITAEHVARVYLVPGLKHLDDDKYDYISDLYEQLQLSAIEASDLMLDFLTFANNVHSFALIGRSLQRRDRIRLAEGGEEYVQTSSETHGFIGFVYFTSSHDKNSALYNTEFNVGIIIHPQFRRQGYARQAIQLALDHAFGMHRCHRVQATITNPYSEAKYPVYRLFTSAGFRQEGVRRRAYYNPFENEWQDIAYMAILDTDWALQRGQRPRNQHHPDEKQITTWDEMIFRHTKEREEILHWEERTGDFSDTETIHGFRLDTPMQSDAETSGVSSGNEADSEMESESSRAVSPCFYTDTPANARPPFYLYPAPPPLPQIPPPPETGSRTCSRPVSPSPSTSSNWDLADTEYSSFDELDMNNSSHDSDFDDLYAPPVPI